MVESISIQQARKLVLLSQGLPSVKKKGGALAASLSVIEDLGYIQIDTISAIQRAHHHTLWNRNPRYNTSHLDQLTDKKQIFEYWSHAASYLPMCDYRYSLPRKLAIARGDQNHWYAGDKRLMKSVLQRIIKEGPLLAKDFENSGEKSGGWGSKPAKQALECLFMQGDLMVPYRVNFHKVYDLTERVLPTNVDCTVPDPEEYSRFLVTRYLKANGVGQLSEVVYLLKYSKAHVAETIQEMLLGGELVGVKVGEILYYTLPPSLELLKRPLRRSKLKILSPFDNLLIQRKRIQALFDFNYQLECYFPKDKRQYGYFSLPILWDGKLVARMDCKAERKTGILHIHYLALEPKLSKTDEFLAALSKELTSFLHFNNCNNVQLHRTSPAYLEPLLQAELNQLVE